MKEKALSSVDDLFALLVDKKDNTKAYQALAEKITIGETSFLRNHFFFEALEKHILPEIIKHQSATKNIRIWSAGCSSGEEPYSLAIIIKKVLGDLNEWNISILGTDINGEFLKKAQTGIYSAWSFRNVPAEFQSSYFTKIGNSFQIHSEYKQMVKFLQHNLIQDDYQRAGINLNELDLILCRNVMLYFPDSLKRKIIEKFMNLLRESGWLIVGPAEISLTIFKGFDIRNFTGATAYQKNSAEAESNLLLKKEVNRPDTPANPILAEQIKEGNDQYVKMKEIPVVETLNLSSFQIEKRKERDTRKTKEWIKKIIETDHSDISESDKNLLEEYYGENPDDNLVAYYLAKYYANRQKTSTAIAWIKRILERDPFYAPAYYLSSLILLEEGKLDNSLDTVRSCLYLDPDFLMGYYTLAELYKQTGQVEKFRVTIQAFDKSLKKLDDDQRIQEGEGLTVGDMRTYVASQKEGFEEL